MPEVKKITKEQADEIIRKNPGRKMNQWADLLETIKKDGLPREVTAITRGSAWGLARAAKNAGLGYRILNKGETVLILPPVKPTK